MSNSKTFPLDTKGLVDIFFTDNIYSSYEIKNVAKGDAIKALIDDRSLDGYCLSCQSPSVFHIRAGYSKDELIENLIKQNHFCVVATCTRNHPTFGSILLCPGRLYFHFVIDNEVIIKTGQYPSKADIDFGSLDPAFKNLKPEFRSALGRAIGLNAHGVGIGSFVYLRRIFEELVEESHVEAENSPCWNENEYKKVKYMMDRRIEILHDYLPKWLVDNSKLYGILSKGVHELTDQDCLNHFDLVKTGILLILRTRQEKKDGDKILKEINKLSSDL